MTVTTTETVSTTPNDADPAAGENDVPMDGGSVISQSTLREAVDSYAITLYQNTDCDTAATLWSPLAEEVEGFKRDCSMENDQIEAINKLRTVGLVYLPDETTGNDEEGYDLLFRRSDDRTIVNMHVTGTDTMDAEDMKTAHVDGKWYVGHSFSGFTYDVRSLD